MTVGVVVGAIVLVLGLAIVLAGIFYRPPLPGRQADGGAPTGLWGFLGKIAEQIFDLFKRMLNSRNPKTQMMTLGSIAIILGAAIIIASLALGSGAKAPGDDPSPSSSSSAPVPSPTAS